MKLNNQYRYIGLDFETTGLEVTKDEPIQIGIVELDINGNVVQEFQSLIKPNKKTDELKHIVGFITGLSITDLESAPTREEILPQLQNFFGPNTILIGHNIQFDINFLDAYFPGLERAGMMDTYKLSQSLVHYAPSYALEVLVPHLQIKENKFNSFFLQINNEAHDTEKSHDALYDTKESLAMFIFFIDYLQTLGEEYPALKKIQSQSDGLLAKILSSNPLESSDVIFRNLTIKFPSLTRIAPSNISLSKDEDNFDRENQKRYYIGDINIKDLLRRIASKKQCILSFQNIQKLNIAKMVLQDLGIKNIGFTREDQTINEEMFKNFLNKGTFTEDEFLFIGKYLSHLEKGLGTLDLNNTTDYRIYHVIKDTRSKTRYPVILATHPGVYAMMEEENNFPDYEIFFFDTEWRYKTYNFYLSRPCDLYYTLNLIESFIYKQKVLAEIDNNDTPLLDKVMGNEIPHSGRGAGGGFDEADPLKNFYNFFQVFIGVIFSDTKKIFTNTPAIYIPHDPIIDHGDFYQTTLLRKQMGEHLAKVSEIISPEDNEQLTKQIEHIDKIFSGVVNISKKMYTQSDFYFLYAEAQRYTDRKEFTEIFRNNIYFLSNSNNQYESLPVKGGAESTGGGGFKNEVQPISIKIPTRNLDRIETITKHIQSADEKIQNIFIFSPRKEESQKIFEDLCQKDIHKSALLLVENITGGVGKNVFKASAEGRKIIIGGNSFLLYLYSNDITIDEVILFNSKGGSEQSILQDIQRYYPK